MCEALKIENGRNLRGRKSVRKKEHSPGNGFYPVVTHTTGICQQI